MSSTAQLTLFVAKRNTIGDIPHAQHIYDQHRKAFSNVSAYVVMAGEQRCATIAFKFPKDGAGRLYAYMHYHLHLQRNTRMKFKVRVRRVVREDVVLEVEATSMTNAIDLAIDEATIVPQEKWDCYDCDYFCDLSDVSKGE